MRSALIEASLTQGAPHLFGNGAGRQEKDQEVLTAGALVQQIGQLKVERDFFRSRMLRVVTAASQRHSVGHALTEKKP